MDYGFGSIFDLSFDCSHCLSSFSERNFFLRCFRLWAYFYVSLYHFRVLIIYIFHCYEVLYMMRKIIVFLSINSCLHLSCLRLFWQSNTLQEGLRKILLFEDVTRKNKKAAAEAILANQKLRLQKDEEKRQKVSHLVNLANEKRVGITFNVIFLRSSLLPLSFIL